MKHLASKPVARLIGALILLQGVVATFFWKILDYALATGMARYSNASGRLARAFFSDDRQLVELLQFGQDWLPLLLYIAIATMLSGILVIAFPSQSAQILTAFRVIHPAQD